MTLVVQEDIIQLEVPVDDAALVQVVQGQADLRAVEPGQRGGEQEGGEQEDGEQEDGEQEDGEQEGGVREGIRADTTNIREQTEQEDKKSRSRNRRSSRGQLVAKIEEQEQ